MTLQQLASQMEPIICSAGTYVKSAVPQNAQDKTSHRDLVTEYDVNTQRMLTKELSALHPDAKFMGEEEHLQTDITTGDCFVIDPIDGTANFVKGLNRSCVSVAMLRDGNPVIGIVYNPFADEYFSAVKGFGSFCNGKPLSVHPCPLNDSIVGVGTCPYYTDLTQRTLRILSGLMEQCMDIRRMGAAALDLCDVAANRTGAFFELLLSPWDYAAAGLILTEAGGIFTDTCGNSVSLEHPCPIVAGNPIAQKELLHIIGNVE